MLLDDAIKTQLADYLKLMEGDVYIKVSLGTDEISKEMDALLHELAEMSSFIHIEKSVLPRTPSFTLNRFGEDTGITFAGVPLGHEFSSLVLALLQTSGRAPKVDASLIERIKSIKGTYHFETYVSLSCHNCPEVVQALNLMSLLHPDITHTMIDGDAFQNEVEKKEIMNVPAIFLKGEFFGGGRLTLEEILNKMGQTIDPSVYEEKELFDVLIIGGGPAGASAAVYAARKGIRTGLVADRFGGQVQDTLGIENFISVLYTEGPKLAASLEEQLKHYGVDLMNQQRVVSLNKTDHIALKLENGATLKSKTVILATGARWRNVGVPGEDAFKNKGVAYCPHCDGPL